MVIKKLETIEIETVNGVRMCSIRAYLLREVPIHPDRKLLMQRHCYLQCNSTCPKNPEYGGYI